jgi:hypothetical protein
VTGERAAPNSNHIAGGTLFVGQQQFLAHSEADQSFPLRVISRMPTGSRRAISRKPSCLIS